MSCDVWKQRCSCGLRKLLFISCGLGSMHSATGQVVVQNEGVHSYTSTQVSDALAKVKAGEVTPYYAEVLGASKVKEAIPFLEEQFSKKTDLLGKLKIAQVLVTLHAPSTEYFTYLYERADDAVSSDAPEALLYDLSGNTDPTASPTKEFIRWAENRGRTLQAALQEQLFFYPSAVTFLGATKDPRALPILRRGLYVASYETQIAASAALAEMQDADSIARMITLCQTEPADVAKQIARNLVYFDDAGAQQMVDTYLDKSEAKIIREGRKHGRSPYK